MTISIPDIKKKILTQFDKTVKAATTRAIPIVKKEAINQIRSTSKNPDIIIKVFTSFVLVGVVLCSGDTKTSSSFIPFGQTVVNIETLNLTIESVCEGRFQ